MNGFTAESTSRNAPAAPHPVPAPPVVSLPPPHRSASFLRRHWKWLLPAAAVAVGGAALGYNASRQPAVAYETVKAKRGELRQTVTATGAVKSASEFSLNFEAAGRVDSVNVKKGDAVKAGDVLATIEATDYTLTAERARAALAEAEANLAKAVAGATPEDIRVKEAALAEAEANAGQASTTLENALRSTALDIETADIELRQAKADRDAEATSLDDSRRNKEQTIVMDESGQYADLSGSAVTMATSLTDVDNILGVDNTTANDAFEQVLSSQDPAALNPARDAYKAARDAKVAFDGRLAALKGEPTGALLDDLTTQARAALALSATALARTRATIDATAPSGLLTLAELNTKKTTIDTDRTAITAKLATLAADASATALARIDRDAAAHDAAAALATAELSLVKAEHDKETAVLAADTTVASDRASLTVAAARRDQAVAQLDLIKAALRDVDRAPLAAAVAQARAAAAAAAADLGKTRIVAPTDGIVTDAPINVGELTSGRSADALASGNTAAISMLATHYEVEADVPETDVAKVQVGQVVDITLDALGRDVHFPGSVLAINPAETVIQDIVYYKMRVVIGKDSDLVKPGMTANLTVATNSKPDALTIPLRAVREDKSGQRYVEALVNGAPQKRPVTLGLRGDEGMTEVLSGIAEGDEVVVATKTK